MNKQKRFRIRTLGGNAKVQKNKTIVFVLT